MPAEPVQAMPGAGEDRPLGLIERLRCEWTYLTSTVRLLHRLKKIADNPNRTISDQMAEIAARFADRPALIGDDSTLTYRQLDSLANRYARWARANGIARGGVVAVLMANRPEFVAAWLGIVRAGGVAALLNFNQRGPSLAHSIALVAPRLLVLDSDLAATFETARELLDDAPPIWTTGRAVTGTRSLDMELMRYSGAALEPGERPALTTDDPALYVYTSGTTGLPKAATITHYRVLTMMNGFSAATRATAADRVYVPLPLYHSSGGLAGIGTTLTVGGSAIVRRQFSASRFWHDCVELEATMFQYIGELCRYLVNSPECEPERRHRIRLACGNGLRPDIWRRFQERFRIPRIVEFYGATEGNVVLVNFDGREGAIGRLPGWLKLIFKIALVRHDGMSADPMRDAAGRCIPCKPGEIGEALGSIERNPKRPTNRFDGYADASETERKVLRDVFKPGDMWFRTGDLMRTDRYGYYYFVDRIGDTFRWKGENVSTAEVAAAIAAFDGIAEANVYGVAVPGYEGRAGMALIVPLGGAPDLAALAAHLAASLPDYARPVFVRIGSEIEKTSTFKQRKQGLSEEGFDPDEIGDALYFADAGSGTLQRLDAGAYGRICRGEVRL